MTPDDHLLLDEARRTIALAAAAGRAGGLDEVSLAMFDRVIFGAVRVLLESRSGVAGSPTYTVTR